MQLLLPSHLSSGLEFHSTNRELPMFPINIPLSETFAYIEIFCCEILLIQPSMFLYSVTGTVLSCFKDSEPITATWLRCGKWTNGDFKNKSWLFEPLLLIGFFCTSRTLQINRNFWWMKMKMLYFFHKITFFFYPATKNHFTLLILLQNIKVYQNWLVVSL